MNLTAIRIALATATLGAAAFAAAPEARADMFGSTSGACLANSGGQAVMTACRASQHDNQIRYIPGENVFYGPLQQGGRCLDVSGGNVVFTGCNGSRSQVWKLSGAGQLNNEAGQCVAPSGSRVSVRGCPATGAWLNLTYRMMTVPGLNVPAGTPLSIRGADLVNARTGQVVAPGGANVVAAGSGNVVAPGGANVVAAGGGNIAVGPNAARAVAAGGGN
jgi:hypothetical protein